MAIHTQKSIKIEQGAWTEKAEYWIGQAVEKHHLPSIRYQVNQHIAQLFYLSSVTCSLSDEKIICGAFVLRIDGNAENKEGVIVAAAGHVAGIDLMATCIPAIENKFIGCCAIRYHTGKPAVAKKMARLGYIADEIVCRKGLSNG